MKRIDLKGLLRFNWIFTIGVSFLAVPIIYIVVSLTSSSPGPMEYSTKIALISLYIVSIPIFLYLIHGSMFNKLKYYPCPYCNKSMKIKLRWVCDRCRHTQKKERYVTQKCDECFRKLESVFCEHCHKEVGL